MCEKNSNAIALFDSGVGGVTILKKVVSLLPYEEVIYYADSANCPYGGKSEEVITSRSEEIVRELIARGAKLIVVACNTATTNSINRLRDIFPDVDIVGTEPAVRPAIAATRCGVVGVIATRGTIQSNQVGRLTERYANGETIHEVACDGLVEFIEQGKEHSTECKALLRRYIEPLIDKGIDVLALGCTHYPFLLSQIEEIIGDRDIIVINPAEAIARRVKSLLEKRGLLRERHQGGVTFLSSCGDREYCRSLEERFSADY